MSPNGQEVSSFAPFFGKERKLACGPLERIEFKAGDGSRLLLHHARGGDRGPVLMTPGTAMTALTYCVDTVPQNIVEFLVDKGFDVWLFDWRTSPLLEAHNNPYTLDDVARYDWPAAIEEVQKRTNKGQVSVLAHCLSCTCLLLSLLRGYTPSDGVRVIIASAVGLHLVLTTAQTLKLRLYLDKILPSGDMVHQKPDELAAEVSDHAASILARVFPTSYSRHAPKHDGKTSNGNGAYCDNDACYRHAVTFGEVILHSRLNEATHRMMGDLIPECKMAFLKDVAIWVRHGSVLGAQDVRRLNRLQVPIYFMSGSENRMFLPEATERTFSLLSKANDQRYYKRKVYPQFGHVDCYVGEGAKEVIWPDIARALEPQPPYWELPA